MHFTVEDNVSFNPKPIIKEKIQTKFGSLRSFCKLYKFSPYRLSSIINGYGKFNKIEIAKLMLAIKLTNEDLNLTPAELGKE